MQKVSLQIGGMTCQSCASRIEKVLNKKDFVQKAGVNFASEEAQITFDEKQTSVEQLIQIIQKTGFTAQLKQEQVALPQERNISWRLILLWLINVPFLIGMLGMMLGPDVANGVSHDCAIRLGDSLLQKRLGQY